LPHGGSTSGQRGCERHTSRPENREQQKSGSECDLPPDRTVRPSRAPEPPVTVTEIPADDSGDEEEQTRKAGREHASILPAWSSRPSAAVLSRREYDDSDDQRDQQEELDVHCVNYRFSCLGKPGGDSSARWSAFAASPLRRDRLRQLCARFWECHA